MIGRSLEASDASNLEVDEINLQWTKMVDPDSDFRNENIEGSGPNITRSIR